MASTSNEECGFDNQFVADVSEHLKCPVCMLVLRQPVQIMNCGHRFCKPCFHRIQTYSEYLKSPLLCPIDKNPVNLGMVFQDNGVCRMIDDLEVKCGSSEQGCNWIGTLRNLEDHQIECEHQQQSPAVSGDDSTVDDEELTEMKRRLETCEDSAVQQRNDAELLKKSYEEMEKRLSERDEEIEILKEAMLTLQKEVRSSREVTEVFRTGFAAEVEYLKSKWKVLDENVHFLNMRGLHFSDIRRDSDEYMASEVGTLDSIVNVLDSCEIPSNDGMCAVETDDILYTSQQVKTNRVSQYDKSIQTSVYQNEEEYGLLPKEETLSVPPPCAENTNLEIIESEEGNEEVGGKLSAYEKEILTQIDDVKLEEMPIVPSASIESSSNNASATATDDERNEEPIKDPTADEQMKENRKEEKKQAYNIENQVHANEMMRLDKHIRNIENILFAYNRQEKPKKDIKLKWVLQNYEHHFNIGETVSSPVYATNIKGYYFKMFIRWNGDAKQNLGLYLRICGGDNDRVRPLPPFESEYTLEIMDRKGGSRSFYVSTPLINEHREDCFVIHPGERQSRFGFGDDEMLSTTCMKKYVIDDTMFISCTIHSRGV